MTQRPIYPEAQKSRSRPQTDHDYKEATHCNRKNAGLQYRCGLDGLDLTYTRYREGFLVVYISRIP